MLCKVYDKTGEHLLLKVEREPECGKDFCDDCGDCLACYGGDPCYHAEDGEHRWVVYADKTSVLERLKITCPAEKEKDG